MKTKLKHQLLAAVGIDSLGHIFPIAIAIVKIENNCNWTYFMNKLKISLERFNIDFKKLLFVSDRDKGLLNSIDTVFSLSENFFCMRHLAHNLKLRYKSKDAMNLFFICATTLIQEEFVFNFKKLSICDSTMHLELFNLGVEKWSICNNRLMTYNYNCSNLIESFNNSIRIERKMSFDNCIDSIIIKYQHKFLERSIQVSNSTDLYSHIINKKLLLFKEKIV